MTTRRTLLIAAAAVSGLIAVGAVAASAGSDDPAPRYGTANLPAEVTPDQRQAIEAMQSDAPIPVQDREGTPRGFVRDSALTARDERVVGILRERFREPTGPDDQPYFELFEALRVLDPVPVVDAQGATVGYWTHDFNEIALTDRDWQVRQSAEDLAEH
jgi:hypothetical protein